jgi:YggT family protein
LGIAQGFGWSFLGVVVSALRIYFWVIIVRALLSWVSPDPYNPIVRALVAVTEPVLRPLRRLVPPHRLGGLDLSPLIALLLIEFVINGLVLSFGMSPRFVF